MNARPDWFVALKIPAGKLEDYMLYAYQNGGELREFAPEDATRIEELTKALPGSASNGTQVPQISDQTKPPRKTRLPADEGGQHLAGTCKGFILKHLRRRPRYPRDLRQLATEKGVTWDLRGIDARLSELKDKGLVKITPKGWDLTDEGRAYSKQALVGSNDWKKKDRADKRPRVGAKTQVDVVEEILKAAYPNFVLLSQMRAEFVKRKLRPNSSSTALHWMKVKGRCVAGAEPATYQWIPLDQRAPAQEETT